MGDDYGNCLFWALIAFYFSPLVLQYYGVANSEWVVSESCLQLHNKPSCCDASNPDSFLDDCRGSVSLSELSDPVYIIQVSAAIFLTVCAVLLCCVGLFSLAKGDFTCCRVCNIPYAISGLLSITGCILFAMEYPGQTYGHSFNTCLASGIIVVLLSMIIGCCSGGNSSKAEDTTQRKDQQTDRISYDQI